MDDELAEAFGKRVRFTRQRNGLTQAVVAGLSGITTDYLYQIERGKKLPALPVAIQLARVLRAPLSTLLGEEQPIGSDMEPLEAGAAIHQALTWTPPDDAPVHVAHLHNQVKHAWRTWQSSQQRYSQLGDRLPSLIAATENLRRVVCHRCGTTASPVLGPPTVGDSPREHVPDPHSGSITTTATERPEMPMCGSWAIACGRWPPSELSGGEGLAGSPASGSARPPTPGAGGGQKVSGVSR